MSQNIEKGTQLLIFKSSLSDKKNSRYLYYLNFIKGTVINTSYEDNKYDNESYKIYTVLGSDGKKYKGEYGDYSDLPNEYFFLTLDDYTEKLKSIMQRKIEETNQIKSDLNMLFEAYQKTCAINNFKVYTSLKK